MPTKIGLHAFHANPYLHEFFEPILFFDPHGPKRKFGHFEDRQNEAKISETSKAMPTILGVHVHLMVFMTSRLFISS